MTVIAGHEFRTPQLIIGAAGVVMLMNSLLPWYGYDANGWHPTYIEFQSGFLAFLPLLITVLIAGTVITAVWSDSTLPTLGTGQLTWNALFLIADVLAALLIVLFWATLPSLDGASSGPKIGTYIGLIVVLAQGVGAFLALAAEGHPVAARLSRSPRRSQQPQ